MLKKAFCLRESRPQACSHNVITLVAFFANLRICVWKLSLAQNISENFFNWMFEAMPSFWINFSSSSPVSSFSSSSSSHICFFWRGLFFLPLLLANGALQPLLFLSLPLHFIVPLFFLALFLFQFSSVGIKTWNEVAGNLQNKQVAFPRLLLFCRCLLFGPKHKCQGVLQNCFCKIHAPSDKPLALLPLIPISSPVGEHLFCFGRRHTRSYDVTLLIKTCPSVWMCGCLFPNTPIPKHNSCSS